MTSRREEGSWECSAHVSNVLNYLPTPARAAFHRIHLDAYHMPSTVLSGPSSLMLLPTCWRALDIEYTPGCQPDSS